MYIESVQLKNFRNYDSLELDLAQGTNIFYGNNAQGKTNILEALYLCGTTKSHKGSKDKDMIRFGEDESHIRMMVKRDELSYKIDMHLRKNKAKGVAINGLPIRKVGELFGVVNLVFFSPEDLNIIKNGPGERRRFIDLIKAFPFTITGMRDFNEAIITQGGVKTKEINPSTMESKKVKNLYFIGEVLDLDAVTGGFNLQIAWSTAYAAVSAICMEE